MCFYHHTMNHQSTKHSFWIQQNKSRVTSITKCWIDLFPSSFIYPANQYVSPHKKLVQIYEYTKYIEAKPRNILIQSTTRTQNNNLKRDGLRKNVAILYNHFVWISVEHKYYHHRPPSWYTNYLFNESFQKLQTLKQF